jgi:hypothetical protein
MTYETSPRTEAAVIGVTGKDARNVSGIGGSPAFAGATPAMDQLIGAVGAKRAGRLSASIIPHSEREELLRERQQLLDKKFGGSITRSEENRLAYVRWTLDRIEDALYGPILDQIESRLFEYERLKRDIVSFQDVLQSSAARKRRA